MSGQEQEITIANRDESCIWKHKKVCSIPVDIKCPVDCSLKSLAWDKDAIIAQMKREEAEVYRLKKISVFKHRREITDLIGGIITMQRCLSNNFQYIEPRIVETDIERPVVPPKQVNPIPETLPKKGWRNILKKW